LGEANVRKAIGDVQQFRDDRDAALVSYNEALKLFKEIGAKLGEANVRKAIGDVQQFRDDRDAALVSYNEALKLFKEIGDKLGEANTLQSLGKAAITSAADQSSFENGIEIIQAAMKLHEEIHDVVGQINILIFLSQVMANMNQIEKALELANEALPMLVNVAGENHPVTLSFRQFIEQLKKAKQEDSSS
jgi:tetratricopeptide (TPR) repeat protein